MTACTQLQTRACVRTGVACRAAPRSRALRAAHATRRSSTPLRASERDGAPAGVLAEVADTSRLWQRGEWLFGAQALALLGVAAPPEQLDAFFAAAGVGSVVAGAAFALAGVRDLGASLSPFPVPSRDNALVTDGVYAMVRHPMYTGLLLGAFGTSLATASPARMVFTVALWAVLNAKMDIEERALQEMHAGYAAYAERTPRVLPDVPVVTPAARSALAALAAWAAGAAAADKDA